MPLSLCSLCRKLYNPISVPGNKGVCSECLSELDEKYSHIHKYIATLGEITDTTPQGIAEELGMNPEDIKLLFDMGYFDRDIQTYSRTASERQKLAKEFERTLHDMKEQAKTETYGGVIYRRRKQ